jgi:hypothetical protein
MIVRSRVKRAVSVIIFLTAPVTTTLPAQSAAKKELRTFVGGSFGVGQQRRVYDDSWTVGIQGALEMRPSFHLVGTVGWILASDNYGLSSDVANVFQYDLGVELGFGQHLRGNRVVKPFLGAGAGARTYFHEAYELANRTCLAAYGGAGIEFQLKRTAWRMEARDNVFCYRSPSPSNAQSTRNDVTLSLGFAYHLR